MLLEQNNTDYIKKWQVALVKLNPWRELIWRQVEKRSASWYSFKYQFVFGGTGSVEGTTCWYLEGLGQYYIWITRSKKSSNHWILGQQRAVLVDIWWYWVGTGRYWLPAWWGFRNIWFTWFKPSNHWILGQQRAVLVGTHQYWVRTGRYWLPVWYAFRNYMVCMVLKYHQRLR